MRASAALVCAVALLGCGHDEPPASTPDGGALLSCPASEKPLGTSALAGTPQVFHPPDPLRVGQLVPFDVPDGTASITIVEQAVSAPDSITLLTSGSRTPLNNTAVPLVVKDPAGNKVFDDNQDLPADLSTLPVFFASESPATGTLTIPNTTAGLALLGTAGLPAGKWSFLVSDFAYECTSPAASPLRGGATCESGTDQSLYDVTVITKPAVNGGVPSSGTLDLAFYLATTIAGGPGAAPLDAGAASRHEDPDLERMVATLRQLFGQAGIGVGNVSYTLLAPDVLATYATGVDIDQSGACAPLAQLLKLAQKGDTLNIFFVSIFKAGGLPSGNTVVGVDGTIPGPSSIGGTVASGAAVATLDLRSGSGTPACAGSGLNLACGADRTAYIIAHEAGHFLGLYHVTESQGTLFDPIADTATCLCSACKLPGSLPCADATPPPASGSEHLMSVPECSQGATGCGGGTNLMFWKLDASLSKGLLTPGQQAILRANPLVQTTP